MQPNGLNIVVKFGGCGVGQLAIEGRPESAKALTLCEELGAELAVAKLDRLFRSTYRPSDGADRFQRGNDAQTDKFQPRLFAASAQQEQELIASRTNEAVAALQKRADNGGVQSVEKITCRNA